MPLLGHSVKNASYFKTVSACRVENKQFCNEIRAVGWHVKRNVVFPMKHPCSQLLHTTQHISWVTTTVRMHRNEMLHPFPPVPECIQRIFPQLAFLSQKSKVLFLLRRSFTYNRHNTSLSWRKLVGLSDKAWIPPGPLHHVTIIQL